jgi:hypothetical protein
MVCVRATDPGRPTHVPARPVVQVDVGGRRPTHERAGQAAVSAAVGWSGGSALASGRAIGISGQGAARSTGTGSGVITTPSLAESWPPSADGGARLPPHSRSRRRWPFVTSLQVLAAGGRGRHGTDRKPNATRSRGDRRAAVGQPGHRGEACDGPRAKTPGSRPEPYGRGLRAHATVRQRTAVLAGAVVLVVFAALAWLDHSVLPVVLTLSRRRRRAARAAAHCTASPLSRGPPHQRRGHARTAGARALAGLR